MIIELQIVLLASDYLAVFSLKKKVGEKETAYYNKRVVKEGKKETSVKVEK